MKLTQLLATASLLSALTSGCSAAPNITRAPGAGSTTTTNVTVPRVSYTVLASTWATAASGWTAVTGLSATITPTLSTDAVHVEVCFGRITREASSSVRVIPVRVLRAATPVGLGTAASTRTRATFSIPSASSNLNGGGSCHSFVDSPGTTSATTYTVQVFQDSTLDQILVNGLYDSADTDDPTEIYARAQSTITLMEVAP